MAWLWLDIKDPITAIHPARWPVACWAPSRTWSMARRPGRLPGHPLGRWSAQEPLPAFPSASNWAAAGGHVIFRVRRRRWCWPGR